MSKFKIGDKVKVIDASGDDKSRIGDICTVYKIDPGYTYYEGDLTLTTRDRDGVNISMYEVRFELVPEAPGFKVGDRVVLIENYSLAGKGEVGTVVHEHEHEATQVKFDNGTTCWPFTNLLAPSGPQVGEHYIFQHNSNSNDPTNGKEVIVKDLGVAAGQYIRISHTHDDKTGLALVSELHPLPEPTPERKDWTELVELADNLIFAYSITDPNGHTGDVLKQLRDALIEESYR